MNLSGIDRQMLSQYLAHAEKHIETSRRRVERQLAAVRRLKQARHVTGTAQELLAQFCQALNSFETDRDRILHLCGSSIPRATRSAAVPTNTKARLPSSAQTVVASLLRKPGDDRCGANRRLRTSGYRSSLTAKFEFDRPQEPVFRKHWSSLSQVKPAAAGWFTFYQ